MKHKSLALDIGTAYISLDLTDKCIRFGMRPIDRNILPKWNGLHFYGAFDWTYSFHQEVWFDQVLHARIIEMDELRQSNPDVYYKYMLPHYNEIVYSRQDDDICSDCGQFWWHHNPTKCA